MAVRSRWMLAGGTIVVSTALARTEAPRVDKPVSADRAQRSPVEVIVYGDPFARWDGTRWLVRTQVGFPAPFLLVAERNHQIEVLATDLTFVMACEKTWRTGDRRYEVDCRVEDAALQVARSFTPAPHLQSVVGELRARMVGKSLQLIVGDDGRILDIGLDGNVAGRERQGAQNEQARQLLARAMVGFQLKLPGPGQIQQGQWVEYDSQLFDLPHTSAALGIPAEGTPRTPVIGNALSGSYVIHQLDRYQGHLVVQSLGEAGILMGDSDFGTASGFKVSLDGVAIFDEGTGILSERVWAFRGKASAGAALASGGIDPYYFNTGRFQLLTEDQHPDVGPSGQVAAPGATAEDGLAPWPAFD